MDEIDRARAPPAPRRAPRRPSATWRGRPAVSVGTVSKALNNSGRLSAGDPRQGHRASPSELGFRPNDLAQSLHRGQSFTVGLISNDCFGRFTMPIMEGLEACLADSRIAVFMCNATDDPEREAPARRAAPRQAGRRHRRHRPPRRPAREARRARSATCRSSTSSRRPTTRRLLPAARRRRRGARSRPSTWRGSAAAASPTSPARSASRRCACVATATATALAEAGLDEPTASTCPASGPRAGAARRVAQLFAGRRDAARCASSAATTRSPAASLDALRERGIARARCGRRRRLRQLGDHGRGERGRRSPAST